MTLEAPPAPERLSRRARRSRRRKVLAILVVAVVLAVLALWRLVGDLGGSGRPGPEVTVVVGRGMGVDALSADLARLRVVRDPRLFSLWVQAFAPVHLRAGIYRLRRRDGWRRAVASLRNGPVGSELTVVPDASADAIAAAFAKLPGRSAAQFLAAEHAVPDRAGIVPEGVASSEGLLWPGTYTVLPGESAQEVVREMVARFSAAARQLDLSGGARRLGLSPYQVVIEASILPREARDPGQYAEVAEVIDNRLARSMPLQLDSTLRFGLHLGSAPIDGADLASENPFNTYRHLGLPPSPIGNPDARALFAALHPASGPWLYFGSPRPGAPLVFSRTLSGRLRREQGASTTKQAGRGG